MTKHPDVKRFATNVSHEYVAPRLQTRSTDFFYARIKALMPKCDKCLNVDGDHIKV